MKTPPRPPESPADDFDARLARAQEASDRRWAKVEHHLAEAAKWREKTERLQAESATLMKTMLKEHGSFTHSEGLIFEEEVVLAVTKTRGIGDIALDTFTEDVRSMQGNQFDLVGINGKCAVIVEAKRSLRLDDITKLADKSIPALKADFPTLKGKSVKGAIVYRRIYGKPAKRRDIARAALTRGIILVRATGKNKLHHIKTEAEVNIPARDLKTPAN